VVLKPASEKFGEFVGRLRVPSIQIVGESLRSFSGGVMLQFVPFVVGALGSAHQPLLIGKMLLNRDEQRSREFLNTGGLRARAHRLVEFLRHAKQIAMLGIDLRQKDGVRLRPLEMLHAEILPYLRHEVLNY
jgi:hypothetical protein